MIDDVSDFFDKYQSVISLLCFFIGLFAGDKLAIGRDKRKEFIAITTGIRLKLERNIQSNNFAGFVDFGDTTLIASHFGYIKRYMFYRIVKKYKHIHKNKETHDSVPYNPTYDDNKLKEIGVLSKRLVRYFKP